MIAYTSKQKVMDFFNMYVKPLPDETFNQFNLIGTSWLFISANNKWHINISLDLLNNSLSIDIFNRANEKTQRHFLNLKRNISRSLFEAFKLQHDKLVLGL